MTRKDLLVALLLAASTAFALAQETPAGALRVGASKVDTTPQPNELPKAYLGVLDKIYSRAIVIDNGKTSAALITLDIGGVRTPMWKEISDRIQTELGIPANNILITATHTHSVPFQLPKPTRIKSSNRSN